jgi:two-component system, NtrC family, sensor histidine kinase PilS
MSLQDAQLQELSASERAQLKQKALGYSWRALNVYTFYRISIVLFLLLLSTSNKAPGLLKLHDPKLFFLFLTSYLSFAFLAMIFNFKRIIPFRQFVYIQVFFDISFTIALVDTSSGVPGGLGILLIVSCVAACLLLSELKALLFPALSSIALLTQQITLSLSESVVSQHFPQTGLLGAACFATSYIAILYSQKLKEAELQSALDTANLERMEKLNEQIIRYMRTGVIVTNKQAEVKVINKAAWKALGTPEISENSHLRYVSQTLFKQFEEWQAAPGFKTLEFKAKKTAPLVKVTFTSLDNQHRFTLILVEDRSFVAQQAQSLKLTSLGRLTASIAHEIRNPLSSINHAAELLQESESLSESDNRLTTIIHKNAMRMNATVENILQLTQKKTPKPIHIELVNFVKNFIQEHNQFVNKELHFVVEISGEELVVFFDPMQLEQIITNLVVNGARYSKQVLGEERVLIKLYTDSLNNICIDVIDYGPGIDKEQQDKLFEPFYTTSSSGTGLGLYLSRELCEGNNARLESIQQENVGACFRLTMPADKPE